MTEKSLTSRILRNMAGPAPGERLRADTLSIPPGESHPIAEPVPGSGGTRMLTESGVGVAHREGVNSVTLSPYTGVVIFPEMGEGGKLENINPSSPRVVTATPVSQPNNQ